MLKTLDAILNDLGLPLHTFPPTFAKTSSNSPGLRVVPLAPAPKWPPDVTAIILNWSRLDNVIRIVSLLCGSWLDDTIAEVYVWNNSPQELSKETFSKAQCDTRKLRIENSPQNLYFYARFLACTKVSTPYCFVQDDDYIILPEVIKTLRARMQESLQSGIYLLPPHEHLLSRLRTTITPSGVHTGFAWLGHGAMIRKQRALEFVSLLHHDCLAMNWEEIKMADNYFTILGNQVPEIWFDQGIALGGGQPFTIGREGDERNRMHIENACRYLNQIIARQSSAAQLNNVRFTTELGFVDTSNNFEHHSQPFDRAPGLGTSFLIETNIKSLPKDTIPHSSTTTSSLLENEKRGAKSMGQNAISHYQNHPLSFAVDGIPDTAFRSPRYAKQGDYILIDVLSAVNINEIMAELVFLVSSDNKRILQRCKFECSSADGRDWFTSPHQLLCRPTIVMPGLPPDNQTGPVIECSVRMEGGSARFFKATVTEDICLPWVIFEVWVRWTSNSALQT
ncbi:hypothetical protein PAXRUDRAFT_166258 [Paxillus rubicundulus Ve08.2h10]|uniref:Uncharacterized protein n=1 Tax=Paxillus rubicundulus Ve08.2h10 TaxID=930991 RepID=A0A0D0CQH7_9AGAM|nr:hypothetical protein PAXRUDRAFT_166258 [Paxillus rubicundulus Ve08.2h10]